MNRQNNDNNTEAVKIANSLKPFAKKWFDEWTQSCVRSKKMTVSTAPNGTVIGVKDAFSDTEVFVKYMAECSSANVGDTVWCKWMYDNMQTLYADSMGDISEKNVEFNNVTVDGVLDVTKRRCFATLSSAGWYRVLTVANYGRAAYSWSIDFTITRAYRSVNNELHRVKLLGVYNAFAFIDEVSKSNVQIIDKIRYTQNDTIGYVDIHLSQSSNNEVSVDFHVNVYPRCRQDFTVNSLEAVADAPSGETVVTTYTFISNGTALDTAYINNVVIPNNISLNSLFYGGQHISSGDLNDYISCGGYYVSSNTYASQISNMPVKEAGKLFVINLTNKWVSATTTWSYFLQVYITYNGAIYVRTCQTGSSTTPSYGTWYKFTTT